MRALESYEEALGFELVKTYIPALNTMRNLGDLYSEIRPDKFEIMYTKALSGYTIVRGSSSDICLYLKRRLDALDVSPRQDATSLKLGAYNYSIQIKMASMRFSGILP